MTDGELIQPFAVDSYKSFVKWLRAQGHEPILLMTPYHHNVWKAPNAPTTKALLAVEPIVRELGRQLNVVVVGSFDPKVIGCREEEFWDSMHARATCLTRIGQ